MRSNANELWKAIRVGNKWKEKMYENHNLSVILSQLGENYIQQLVLKTINWFKPKMMQQKQLEYYSEMKENLNEDIQGLYEQRDLEREITTELTKIKTIVPNVLYTNTQKIAEAMKYTGQKRLSKLIQVRSELESQPIMHSSSASLREVRPPSNQSSQSNTKNASDLRRIENWTRKVHTSPYLVNMTQKTKSQPKRIKNNTPQRYIMAEKKLAQTLSRDRP